MGRLASQPDPTIHHFSHPHPLHLSNYQPQQTLSLASCLSCNLKVSGWIYSCQPCKYFLHISCSKMPQQIKHPFDQNHVLSLLPSPIYKEGFFKCDACGQQGNGFSYHCGVCSIDLHTACASMPLLLSHQSHHHQLDLTFSPPYPNKAFCCDICKNTGSNLWLYRCSLCEFDAHLLCARTNPSAPIPQTTRVQNYNYQKAPPVTGLAPQPQVLGIALAAPAVVAPPLNNYPPNNYMNSANYAAGQAVFGSAAMPVATSGGRQGSNSFNSLLQGLVNINQNFNQELIQGILNGVGGGDAAAAGGGDAAAAGGGGIDF